MQYSQKGNGYKIRFCFLHQPWGCTRDLAPHVSVSLCTIRRGVGGWGASDSGLPSKKMIPWKQQKPQCGLSIKYVCFPLPVNSLYIDSIITFALLWISNHKSHTIV